MKKLRILSLIMALALCFGLLAGCGGDKADDSDSKNSDAPTEKDDAQSGNEAGYGTFKLGGIGPLTGDNAIYGVAAMNGAQIAVDEINAMDGDIQFEFNTQDDVSNGETSVNAYHTLQDWKMQVLIGPVTTEPAVSVSAEASSDRVFCLTPSASSTDVIDGKDNMFQVCFTDPSQGTAFAAYMAENMADAKVAVIYRNDDAYSQGIRDTFKVEADAKGIEVVYEGTFTQDSQTDFSVQLTGAQSNGADVVFLPIYYQPASVILSQAKQMDYAPTFFGVDGMDGILTMDGFDASLAEGVMLITPFNAWGTSEQNVTFVEEYQKRFNELPNQFAADGYDCVYVIYEALKAAGCTGDMSAEDICEALVGVMPSLSVSGLTGDMTWEASGAVSKSPWVVKIQDGIYVAQD